MCLGFLRGREESRQLDIEQASLSVRTFTGREREPHAGLVC